jgi:hypothetical protein
VEPRRAGRHADARGHERLPAATGSFFLVPKVQYRQQSKEGQATESASILRSSVSTCSEVILEVDAHFFVGPNTTEIFPRVSHVSTKQR